ncbi:MAG: HAMP domain-containing sensor histidine kinase [Anaeromyxobacteraceae bacterium]
MNLAAAISIAAATIAVLAGVMSRRLSLVPGFRDQHRFSLVALTAAGYAFCNLATSLHQPDDVVLWASRVQIAIAMAHGWAWLRYSQAYSAVTPARAVRPLGWALLAAAAVFLAGLGHSGTFKDHPFPPFGVVYRDALPNDLGNALMAFLLVAGLVPLVRFLATWRRGVPHAGVHVLAYVALVLFGWNDALATSLPLELPYLLDTGFVIPILAVYWAVTERFAEDAGALERMRAQLAVEVEQRTAELARAEAALSQSERLAALGQFAKGVAHEVNNPASVVTANLRWLRQATAEGTDEPADVAEVVDESLQAMTRINDLVRKLVDAGRIAGIAPGGRAQVGATVRRAFDDLGPRVRAQLSFELATGPDVWVRAQPEALAQVLGHLLTNAAEAYPAGQGGRVRVAAEHRPGSIRITVADEGRGMPADVLRRAFDPFFTTKPAGEGAGLGLAIARGLVEGFGGNVWLESDPGRGTRAVVELPSFDSVHPERSREAAESKGSG